MQKMSTSVEFLQASIWEYEWWRVGEWWGSGGSDQSKNTPDKRKTWAAICYSNSKSPVLREKESIGNNLNSVMNKRVRVPIGCWVRFYKAQERHSEGLLSLLMKYQYKVWRQKCSQVIWNGKLNFWIKTVLVFLTSKPGQLDKVWYAQRNLSLELDFPNIQVMEIILWRNKVKKKIGIWKTVAFYLRCKLNLLRGFKRLLFWDNCIARTLGQSLFNPNVT